MGSVLKVVFAINIVSISFLDIWWKGDCKRNFHL